MDKTNRRNMVTFGMGTIGRDMFYTMVSMFLMVYLTEVLNLNNTIMWWMTGILTVLRVFDAVNDPIAGIIVDNTRSRFGKFKPWMMIGAVVSAAFMLMMFTDLGLTGAGYLIFFAIMYLGWDIFFGLNDIAYWSMLPTLSVDQKIREKMGSFARICASLGMFAVVLAILPGTQAIGIALGGDAALYQEGGSDAFLVKSWFVFALIVIGIMIAFQLITVFGVKENKGYFKEEEKTTLRDMMRAIFKNDQLMWLAISLALFMVGYMTTTSFGVHFFKYAYGDANMFSVFSAVLGVSQLAALAVFPLMTKKLSRRKLYTLATVLVVVGYVLFYFSPMSMVPIAIAAMLIFVGQAFIQTLMLMFLADSIEYGQWKLGKRNDSITFSVQPFIYKIGGAIANAVLGTTLILSGLNEAQVTSDATPQGIAMMKFSMMIIPLIVIVAGYLIYLKKFKIDEQMYAKIISDLRERGDIGKTE